MTRSLQSLVVMTALSAVLGCGPSVKPLPMGEREAPGSVGQLKKDLEGIAESGSGQSALEPVGIGMEALDKSHPQHGKLVAAHRKLLAAATPDQRKTIAKEMIGLLETK